MSEALYVDGGVIGSNPSPFGGTWAWCQTDSEDHRLGRRLRTGSGIQTPYGPYSSITNNYSEMLAMVEGLESLPDGWTGAIYSDSDVTLGRVFRRNSTSGIPDSLMERAFRALARLDLTRETGIRYYLLKSHPNRQELALGYSADGRRVSHHNVWCDKECKQLGRGFLESLERGYGG